MSANMSMDDALKMQGSRARITLDNGTIVEGTFGVDLHGRGDCWVGNLRVYRANIVEWTVLAPPEPKRLSVVLDKWSQAWQRHLGGYWQMVGEDGTHPWADVPKPVRMLEPRADDE